MSITHQTDSPEYDRESLEQIADGNRVVLNCGCGTDDRGIGIDINYNPDIEWDLNDGIPVADDSVDVVVAEHVLEHLSNPSKFLAEAARVLRSDGRLELEVPNVGWWPVRLWMTQDLHRFWSHKNPERDGHWLARRLGNDDEKRTAHRSLWTPALLQEHLDRAGFSYEFDGRHWSRNLSVTATPTSSTAGQTLHELERAAGDDLASGDYWAQTRARVMSSWVADSNPRRVLDIGCGSGYLTARIDAETNAEEVVGIDSDSDSIQVARRRDCEATFHVGDAFDLEWADDSADVIVFGDVLEHLETPEAALREARRVLAPGGSVVVSLPAYRALWGPHDEHNGHHDRYTTERFRNVAETAGYRLTRHRYTNLAPLPVYWFYQRVLEQQVPQGARGGHDGLLERVKALAIEAEVWVPWPVGITLIAEVEER